MRHPLAQAESNLTTEAAAAAATEIEGTSDHSSKLEAVTATTGVANGVRTATKSSATNPTGIHRAARADSGETITGIIMETKVREKNFLFR